MTESEYTALKERLDKYEKANDKISVLNSKKSQISCGILSIECEYDKRVDFDYLGEDFQERLVDNIVSFLDSEIKTTNKCMEDI